MIKALGYASRSAGSPVGPFSFERQPLTSGDILIEILYCGVCHTDLHYVKNYWGGTIYPVVHGHEIIGRVTKTGRDVTGFKEGDIAGVGPMIDSCQRCEECDRGLEQYCLNGMTSTFNDHDKEGNVTYGGYSGTIVISEKFALKIPDKLLPAAAAPLLCAGITTYSPLRHWKAGPGSRVGITGIGGLGHMGVKLARAMVAHVTAITTSRWKAADAPRLGADDVLFSGDKNEMETREGSFDIIISTIPVNHDVNPYIRLLRRDGTLVLLGVFEELKPSPDSGPLAYRRRSLAGSIIGGLAETREMLEFCAAHGISADVEVIPVRDIEDAFRRIVNREVKYRFVVDMASLKDLPGQ